MRIRKRAVPSLAVLVVVLSACAPRPTPTSIDTGAPVGAPAQPTRLTAAVLADPPVMIPKLEKVLPGSEAMEVLVNSALAVNSGGGALSPQLAEQVPSIENGLWKVLPDGTMETTWKIRPNVLWHDGTPFTSADLAFTATVGRDAATPYFRHAGYKWVEAVETPDARTVTVKWQQPYTSADNLFTSSLNNSLYTAPLPRHLLEKTYLEDKGNILDVPYWSDAFVGTGPYKVRQFVRGSHVLLDANDQYVLGRPKIDTIELKFIPEKDTLISNVLSGTVELTIGRGLSLEEALNAASQWRDGRAEFGILNWVTMFPQFIGTDPPVVTNVNFRRALMHAIDRQEMVDTIQKGVVPVAHSYLSPNDPSYNAVEPSIVKYDFDPRKAAQLIEPLGYTRAGDGIYRDTSGQRLSVEVRTTGETSIHRPALLSIADYWQRVGVAVDPLFIPPQRASDREYRSTYPAFELLQHPNGLEGLSRFNSRETSLPENNFTLSGNNGRYKSAELDELIDRFFTTIPQQPRTQVLARIMNHITDQVTMMGLFYQTEPAMIGNRLQNAAAKKEGSTPVWNVHEWSLWP
jgi:peptide/nickel transport system substrate-binding protein